MDEINHLATKRLDVWQVPRERAWRWLDSVQNSLHCLRDVFEFDSMRLWTKLSRFCRCIVRDDFEYLIVWDVGQSFALSSLWINGTCCSRFDAKIFFDSCLTGCEAYDCQSEGIASIPTIHELLSQTIESNLDCESWETMRRRHAAPRCRMHRLSLSTFTWRNVCNAW